MDESIPTPPSAAAAHAASVLGTALRPDDDAAFLSIDAPNPTVLFGSYYDAQGCNILPLTPDSISNGNFDPLHNYLKCSLPSVSSPIVSSSPQKCPAVSAKRPTPRCAALSGLITVAVIVDLIAAGVDALIPPPPRVVRPSPVSVFNKVLSAAAPLR